MNEVLFFIHIGVMGMFALGALRLGQGALIAWVIVQALCANLFVLKQMVLFGYEVTCADVFAIGSILGLNLLQEYRGKESAEEGIKLCFFFLIFFALASQIHLLYTPSPHDWSQEAFSSLLSSSPRLLVASLLAFFMAQKVDLFLFGALKKHFSSLPFAARSACSLTVSQFLDTLLFSFLGLYGLVASLGDIIFVSFSLKILIIASLSFITPWAKKWTPSHV